MYIQAFTDGACKGNPGIGGWGWVAYFKNKDTTPIRFDNWGGLKYTTNQKMELIAVKEFLAFCPKGNRIDVWTDSKYVLGGIVGACPRDSDKQSKLVKVHKDPQGWMKKWKNNKGQCLNNYWNKKDLKNSTEWYHIHRQLLLHYEHGSVISFGWVKGHSGNTGNEIADGLANRYTL